MRRLNERGNRLLLAPSPTAPELEQADRLFAQGLRLNPHCSLCHANRADALLRLDRPAEAEEELKAQTALLPLDSDAHFSLGVALRAQVHISPYLPTSPHISPSLPSLGGVGST